MNDASPFTNEATNDWESHNQPHVDEEEDENNDDNTNERETQEKPSRFDSLDTRGLSDKVLERIEEHVNTMDNITGEEWNEMFENMVLAKHLEWSILKGKKTSNRSLQRYETEWNYNSEEPAPFELAPQWMEELPFDVITTAGHEHMRIAYEYGFKTGGRLDNVDRLVQDGIPIHFIDMDWHNPEFEKLLQTVKEVQPEYVVGGDYNEEPVGDPESNVDLINERAEKLNQYSDNVIVVPHTPDTIFEVPDWAITGYSVPTSYGKAKGQLSHYRGCDIHLLGGAPMKQMKLLQEYQDEIVSIDGNAINKMANVANRYWSGHDWDFPDTTRDSKMDYSDVYDADFTVPRDVAGSHLVDPDITKNRNFEAYERSVLHWSTKLIERHRSGWFNGESSNVLDI